MSDAIPVNKVKERAILVATAHGELERACQEIAKKIDASRSPTERSPLEIEEEKYAGTIVELCIRYGRALNKEVA